MMSSARAISVPADSAVTRDDTEVARATMRRVSLRLFPLLFALFFFNYVDRTNVAMAALQMKDDLGLSATAYGFGAGIFFWGYVLFEVPSNLMLARVGARRWIARIVISWGLIASATAFVRTPEQFYGLRILLGIAEAGFFPGIVYYLSLWFPAAQRARALSRFIIAVPLSQAVGNPLSGWLMGFDGLLRLSGWRLVFLVEGIPSVVLGFIVLAFLTDSPGQARWLPGKQRAWLVERLRRDGDASVSTHGLPPLRALAHPTVRLVSLLYFLYGLTFYGYLYWSNIFVRDTLSASPVVTGLVTGLIACVAAIAMLAAGATSDRRGDRCVHMSVGMALVAVGYVGAALMPSGVGRVVGLGLVLVANGIFVVPFWCLPSMLLRGSAAAAGIALVNSIGNIGGGISPYLIGRFTDVTGSPSGAFLVLAAVAVGAAFISLILRRQPAFCLELSGRFGCGTLTVGRRRR